MCSQGYIRIISFPPVIYKIMDIYIVLVFGAIQLQLLMEIRESVQGRLKDKSNLCQIISFPKLKTFKSRNAFQKQICILLFSYYVKSQRSTKKK